MPPTAARPFEIRSAWLWGEYSASFLIPSLVAQSFHRSWLAASLPWPGVVHMRPCVTTLCSFRGSILFAFAPAQEGAPTTKSANLCQLPADWWFGLVWRFAGGFPFALKNQVKLRLSWEITRLKAICSPLALHVGLEALQDQILRAAHADACSAGETKGPKHIPSAFTAKRNCK